MNFETSYLEFIEGLMRGAAQAKCYHHHALVGAYAAMATVMIADFVPGSLIYDVIRPGRDLIGEPFGSAPSDMKMIASFQALLVISAMVDGVAL
jgi:hypothetical protein